VSNFAQDDKVFWFGRRTGHDKGKNDSNGKVAAKAPATAKAKCGVLPFGYAQGQNDKG
jgi:hypothetical protein